MLPSMTTNAFGLQHPDSPWGDYSDILYQGMAMHLGRRDGLIQLERTGPFVPPITFPSDGVVVTDAFRRDLEAAGLAAGVRFLPVIKARIVRFDDWIHWDASADEPEFYPESGEPEDYILALDHDPEVAEAIGPLWELVCPERAEGVPEFDFWKAGTRIRISPRAAAWLQERYGDWVLLEPI